MDTHRIVTISDKNGVIEIRPTPSLQERMQKHWDKLPPFQGTKTDEELKAAIAEAVAEGAAKGL